MSNLILIINYSIGLNITHTSFIAMELYIVEYAYELFGLTYMYIYIWFLTLQPKPYVCVNNHLTQIQSNNIKHIILFNSTTSWHSIRIKYRRTKVVLHHVYLDPSTTGLYLTSTSWHLVFHIPLI